MQKVKFAALQRTVLHFTSIRRVRNAFSSVIKFCLAKQQTQDFPFLAFAPREESEAYGAWKPYLNFEQQSPSDASITKIRIDHQISYPTKIAIILSLD
jgi:hypothetical protein